MQVLRRCFLQFGLLVLVASALALSAQAASFSVASLKGRYGYMFNKWTVDAGRNQYTEVGVMTFDGAGHMSGSYNGVGGGTWQGAATSGTYTVNPDGTGVLEVTSPLYKPPVVHFGFVLNSSTAGLAHGFQFMQIDNGNNVVISGTALLQASTLVPQSVASLHGSFSFLANSWSADPGFDEQGAFGIFTFDGMGNVHGSFINLDGGVRTFLTFAGSYAVNADGTCTASLVLSNGGEPDLACALNSVGLAGAKGLQLVVTNPGPTGADSSTNYDVTLTAVKQSSP